MLSNREAFADVLGDVESMGSSKAEVPDAEEPVSSGSSDKSPIEAELPSAPATSQE